MPQVKVSVIMPLRNAERFIAEAVESILGQTYSPFQLIAIDDRSTDGTAQILHEYAARDPRMQVIPGPGQGIAAALQIGLACATGEYIARMDGDDISLPERFARQVAHLDAHPDCVLVGSRVLFIDEEGAPIRQWCHEQTHEEIDRAHLEWGWPVVHPAVMMRRSAIDAAGGYRDLYNHIEDLDLFLRLAEIGKLCNLPEVLLKYRKHMGSICQTKGAEQERLKVALYQETYRRRGMAGVRVRTPEIREPRRSELHRLWGWWALQSGHLKTARKHAAAALKQTPLSTASWRLMYCAVRGR